jgi:hypothetical protein
MLQFKEKSVMVLALVQSVKNLQILDLMMTIIFLIPKYEAKAYNKFAALTA